MTASTEVDESKVSLAYCDSLADKASSVDQLPKACHKFKSVMQKLQGGAADKGDAFSGMSPAQIARAKTARAQGRENQAQFQRRMTRSHKMSR